MAVVESRIAYLTSYVKWGSTNQLIKLGEGGHFELQPKLIIPPELFIASHKFTDLVSKNIYKSPQEFSYKFMRFLKKKCINFWGQCQVLLVNSTNGTWLPMHHISEITRHINTNTRAVSHFPRIKPWELMLG